jgi:hypothetical protein
MASTGAESPTRVCDWTRLQYSAQRERLTGCSPACQWALSWSLAPNPTSKGLRDSIQLLDVHEL